MKKTLLIFLSLVFTGFYFCTQNTSGTSEVGNPERVAGTIIDSTYAGIGGISIVMVQTDYTPPPRNLLYKQTDFVDAPYFQTTTDSTGKFFISVKNGSRYNLIASDLSNTHFAMLENITIDSPTDLDSLTLKIGK